MDVKTLCLGALTFGDMTGYDIKKYFEEGFSHFFVAGYGSIYPALAELTREGLVLCTDVEQEKRPDKKVYRITEAGRRTLQERLLATPPRHKVRSEFLVLMYFAHLLPPRHLAEVLDQRLADIEALLNHLEECGRSEECARMPNHRFALDLGLVTLRAQGDFIRDRRRGLLADLASAAEKASHG